MDPKKDIRVRKFVEKIKKEFDIEKIILFGSRVRGDNLKNSDYDFIVVSKDFKGIPFTSRISKMYDFWKYSVPLEVLCYTLEEFEKKKNELCIVKEAVEKGVEIK